MSYFLSCIYIWVLETPNSICFFSFSLFFLILFFSTLLIKITIVVVLFVLFFCSGINQQEDNGKLTSKVLRFLSVSLSHSLVLPRTQISSFFFFCWTSNNQWVTKGFPLIKKKFLLLLLTYANNGLFLFENVKEDKDKKTLEKIFFSRP